VRRISAEANISYQGYAGWFQADVEVAMSVDPMHTASRSMNQGRHAPSVIT
jgi:hypothetical protein